MGFAQGQEPTEANLDEWLKNMGFTEIEDLQYFREETGGGFLFFTASKRRARILRAILLLPEEGFQVAPAKDAKAGSPK